MADMHLTKQNLLALSERIGRALRETDEGPIAYPEAVALLNDLEIEVGELANRLTESETREAYQHSLNDPRR